jgi:hypothetical protein
LIIAAKFGIQLVSHFLIVFRHYKIGLLESELVSELASNELNWNTLKERRIQFAASLMYKITHDLAPKQLIDIFQKTPSSQHYNLRGSTANLYLPKTKIEYFKKGLSYRAANS